MCALQERSASLRLEIHYYQYWQLKNIVQLHNSKEQRREEKRDLHPIHNLVSSPKKGVNETGSFYQFYKSRDYVHSSKDLESRDFSVN